MIEKILDGLKGALTHPIIYQMEEIVEHEIV